MTQEKKSQDTKKKKIKLGICLTVFVLSLIWQAYELQNAEVHYYKTTPYGRIEISQEEYTHLKEQEDIDLPDINLSQYKKEKIK